MKKVEKELKLDEKTNEDIEETDEDQELDDLGIQNTFNELSVEDMIDEEGSVEDVSC